MRPLGDGAVVVNLRTGECFELNQVGFEIWELLVGGTTEESICEKLVGRYPVGREVLAADVRNLLGEMIRRGLIEPAEPPVRGP